MSIRQCIWTALLASAVVVVAGALVWYNHTRTRTANAYDTWFDCPYPCSPDTMCFCKDGKAKVVHYDGARSVH